jgi:ubiquinone/menaquinone biosynthesis C-methylase UbiE
MTSRRRLSVFAIIFGLSFPAVAQSPRASIETSKIFDALLLKEGLTVGEIGAGSGELTLDAARLVGAQGKVFTSELGEDRIKSLQRAVEKSGLSHVTVVTGDPNQTNLTDACCDAIFMRNVYHHFADPAAMNASIFKSLKPGGRVAVVDFEPNRGRPEAARPVARANNESHGVSPTSVGRELREAGFQIVRTEPGADRWFLVVGEKPR